MTQLLNDRTPPKLLKINPVQARTTRNVGLNRMKYFLAQSTRTAGETTSNSHKIFIVFIFMMIIKIFLSLDCVRSHVQFSSQRRVDQGKAICQEAWPASQLFHSLTSNGWNNSLRKRLNMTAVTQEHVNWWEKENTKKKKLIQHMQIC